MVFFFLYTHIWIKGHHGRRMYYYLICFSQQPYDVGSVGIVS